MQKSINATVGVVQAVGAALIVFTAVILFAPSTPVEAYPNSCNTGRCGQVDSDGTCEFGGPSCQGSTCSCTCDLNLGAVYCK